MNAPNFPKQAHSILVVSSDIASASIVDELASLSSNYKATRVSIDKIAGHQPKQPPELIVADLNELTDKQISILESLRKQFKDTPVIVVSEGLDDGQIRQLFHLRIEDWLKRPIDKRQFHNALLTALQSNRGRLGQAHAVLSAAGGVGTTTIATSMAEILAGRHRSSGKSVALFDLDFSTGNCGYVLNCSSSYNLETVINQPSRVDAEFIDIIKTPHEAGFNIFSFKRPEVVIAPTGAELVLRMLDAVTLSHDYTVLDIPYYNTTWRDEVIQAVNTITVVSYLSLPVIKHTRELTRAIGKLTPSSPSTRVVFNKKRSSLFGQSIKSKSIKELFTRVSMTEFPDDQATIEEAANRGVLPSEVNKRSKFLKGLRKHVDEFVLAEGVAK